MVWSVMIPSILFLALLAGLEVGRWFGKRARAGKDGAGTGAADGVVFAVFGLIVAFTFSSSASRFDDRRKLIVQQANALGTAALRLDALEPADRLPIRKLMLRWAELAQQVPDVSDTVAMSKVADEAANVQAEAWRLAAAAVDKKQQPTLYAFVLSPINDWMDLSTTRLSTNDLGTPPAVIPTVIILSVVTAVLAGFHMARYSRSWLHCIAFAGIVALLIYVIFDLNHPRSGLIRVDSVDQAIQQVELSLRESIGAFN